MQTITLANLRAQIAERADVEIEATGRHTTAQALLLINESIRRYWLKFTNNGQSALKTADVSTATGTTQTAGWDANQHIALPTDLLAVEGLSINDGNHWLPMLSFEELERDNFERNFLTADATGLPTAFRVTLNNSGALIARLLPRADAVYTVRVLYVPSPTALSSESDTFSFYEGTSDFVIADVALRILTRDGSPESAQVRELKEQRFEAEKIITNFAHRLNRASSPRRVDVRGQRQRNTIYSDIAYRGR